MTVMILYHLIKKELKQILRNKILPIVFVLIPIGLANMIPRLATQEIKGLKFAVIDNDHSTLSSRLIHKIDASTYLDLSCNTHTYPEAMQLINTGDIDVIVEIPKDFEKNMVVSQVNGDGTSVQISANSVNGTKGTMASMYISQIIASFSQEIAEETTASAPAQPMGLGSIALRFLFNPNLNYKVFMTPAIFAMLMMLIVGFLPALNIVSEKEKGTIEQINVSPISRLDFILSKIIPYVIIGVLMVVEAIVAVRGMYGISCAGSIPLLIGAALLFSMLISSLGLVISNYATTLQQAALVMWFFLMIFLLMSGMLTPIASMPEWAQKLTLINPMRYFIEIMRSIFIKGSSFTQLLPQFGAIVAMAVFGWTWAVLSYKKSQ